MKTISIKNFIQNINIGAFNVKGNIICKEIKNVGSLEYDAEKLAKYIISYFHLEDSYPYLAEVEYDPTLGDILNDSLEEYKKDNYINVKLNDSLKKVLDSYDKTKLLSEYNKYYQNLLTNKEVILYIKEIIDKKDYYNYDMYYKYSKEQCIEEIKTLTHLFNILEDVPFQIGNLGIKEKYISFTPGSYEYENISPFIHFDVYDINHYKRVLKLLEEKIK